MEKNKMTTETRLPRTLEVNFNQSVNDNNAEQIAQDIASRINASMSTQLNFEKVRRTPGGIVAKFTMEHNGTNSSAEIKSSIRNNLPAKSVNNYQFGYSTSTTQLRLVSNP